MTSQKFLRGIIYASLAIVPFLAWYVSESTFYPFITGKNFAFRFLVEISLVAWIILAAIQPAYRPHKSIVFYSYSAFLLVIFIANIFGANPYFSFFSNYERMEGWFTHLHLFLYFVLLYSVYKTDKDWLRMLGWFAVSAIPVGLEALFQYAASSVFPFSSYLAKGLVAIPAFFGLIFGEGKALMAGTEAVTFLSTIYPRSVGRLDASLGNAAYFGIYTLFFVFIFSFLALKVKRWKGGQGWMSLLWVGASAFCVLIKDVIIYYAGTQLTNGDVANAVASFANFIWFVGIFSLIWAVTDFVRRLIEGKIGSWPFALLTLIALFELIYTQTRGSWIGLIGGAGVAILLIAILDRKRNKKFSNIAFSILGLGIFVFGGFFALKDNPTVSNYIESNVILSRFATINVPTPTRIMDSIRNDSYPEMVEVFGESTIVSRILNMKMSVTGWSQNAHTMLLGYGQENYGVIFAEHFDPRMYNQEAWFDRAHNVFMDWLVAGGALGLLAYLALYLTPIYMMWRGKGRHNMQVSERAILTGALVAYFIHNIFVFDNLVSYVIFIALLAYIASRTRIDEKHSHPNEEKGKNPFTGTLLYGIIGAGTVLSLSLLVITVAKPLSANLDIISALRIRPSSYEDLTNTTLASSSIFKRAVESNTFGTKEATEQMIQHYAGLAGIDVSSMDEEGRLEFVGVINEYGEYAKAKMEELIDRHKTAHDTVFYASMLRQVGDNEKALNYAERALEMSPKKQLLLFELANALVANGKYEEALARVQEAYDLEPTYPMASQVLEDVKRIMESDQVVAN